MGIARRMTSMSMQSWAFVLVLLVLACLLLRNPRNFATHLVFHSQNSVTPPEHKVLWSEERHLNWKPCAWWKDDPNELPDLPADSTGYIKVECTGGLNQMRRDLCDGVGIARLLNATLLIPHFDAALYWNDTRYPLYAKSVRCQACYRAIRLVKHLEDQAELMMMKIPRPFMTLHLRFEPDMIAYSQCAYPSLSKESMMAVAAAREGRDVFTGEIELSWRQRGKCLLTPRDVALILKALNMPTSMPIYLATGDGILEKEGFTNVYTNIFTKSALIDGQAISMLKGNSKAALDYYVSINSDYYVATSFGNMEKMVLPMRVLRRNYNTLVLNKKDFGIAVLEGLNASTLHKKMWESHRYAFITGRGLALPDCFCESKAS